MTSIRVGHLYPDYLNIYADRGNIAVLARRAVWRGHELVVTELGLHDGIVPGAHDLYYVGGGQDREQLLVAESLAAKAEPLREAVIGGGAALLAVCGGYQLLGRGYRGFHGEDMPGVGLLPLETVAGERRMIGDVLLETELEPGVRRTIAGFENHAGRTRLDPGAEPLGRALAPGRDAWILLQPLVHELPLARRHRLELRRPAALRDALGDPHRERFDHRLPPVAIAGRVRRANAATAGRPRRSRPRRDSAEGTNTRQNMPPPRAAGPK